MVLVAGRQKYINVPISLHTTAGVKQVICMVVLNSLLLISCVIQIKMPELILQRLFCNFPKFTLVHICFLIGTG